MLRQVRNQDTTDEARELDYITAGLLQVPTSAHSLPPGICQMRRYGCSATGLLAHVALVNWRTNQMQRAAEATEAPKIEGIDDQGNLTRHKRRCGQ